MLACVLAAQALKFRWLTSGDEAFRAAEQAIDGACRSVRLEVYTYADSAVGRRIRDRLTAAAARGALVRVLVDGVGSFRLPGSFWEPLVAAGGQVRVFNPISLERFAVRDHRKLLVCDEAVAILGGFNIAPEYEGDGVTRGWCDLAMQLEGEPARALAASFDSMFEHADFRHKRPLRFRRPLVKRLVPASDWQLLLSGPGRGRNPLLRMLHRDLVGAASVQIAAAYFLPTRRLRRKLMRVARAGGTVRLLLPGKTDVQLSQLAAQCLYTRLLKAGVEIYEYQPQILHAKLIIVDDAVYVGSANLDPRSLRINYDLMVRFHNVELAEQARSVFDAMISRARRIELEEWRASLSWWQKLLQRLAYYLLVRVDPYVAAWQYRRMRR
ncbi:MAG: phosphatidylserine/phosphatidylglycerophosphate/cardiolipin synthase family protein [Verrucomicrobiae bacterium]|nr:phosphatidylserine/phosphatidylglycerophosphate/cardiolipin synthase family protein [Verrucomicrobiae bacterium]